MCINKLNSFLIDTKVNTIQAVLSHGVPSKNEEELNGYTTIQLYLCIYIKILVILLFIK